MNQFEVGDRVRIDIPDVTDRDYEDFHDQEGEVVEILPDDGSRVTGDEQDSDLYRVSVDDGVTFDARWRDLRPPLLK